MIHIILDQKNNKGLVRIVGNSDEIEIDFAYLFEQLHKVAPDVFMQMVHVLTAYLEHIKEEELEKHDQNNISNEG